MFQAWGRGRLPGYRPTLADLWALGQGLADPTPVVMHNMPVVLHAFRLTR